MWSTQPKFWVVHGPPGPRCSTPMSTQHCVKSVGQRSKVRGLLTDEQLKCQRNQFNGGFITSHVTQFRPSRSRFLNVSLPILTRKSSKADKPAL